MPRLLERFFEKLRQRAVLIGLGACLLFFVALPAWQLWRMEAELLRLERENSQLSQKNRAILAEIAKLRQDDRYLEQVARREHGLVGKDEVLYRFVKKTGASGH